MAADFNLENKFISQSFEQLVQISGSIPVDGTGSAIDTLSVTSSQANFATTASYILGGDVVGVVESASNAIIANDAVSSSYAATASVLLGSIESASYAATASVLLGSVQSASYADVAATATSASYATSSSLAEEASNNFDTVTYNNSTFALEMIRTSGGIQSVTLTSGSYAISASHAERADASDHADSVLIPARAAEALEKGDPVYISGYNNGQERIEISKADASDSDKMPVVGLAIEDVSQNTNTFVIAAGSLTDVDTSNGLVSPSVGDTLYAAVGGGYTNVKPTGSANLIQNVGKIGRVNQNNGEIAVSAILRTNDLPNIASGQVWAGNNDDVPTAVNTSSLFVSHSVSADTASFLPSDTRLNITDITASNASFTSASIGFLQSITGSAKIIGDAFIELNNDTPVERYAGIKVVDSGSNNTSSLQFDGQTNDWFYEYEGDDPTDHGVVLFGPEYGTKGSPTYNTNNRLVKGDGGHHINDSSITDDGTTVSTDIPISASAGFTGSLHGTADTASVATNAEGLTSGDKTLTGYLEQTFDAPNTNGEKAFHIVNNASVGGKSFDRVQFAIADYPSFGDPYDDYYGIEYYDSSGYNFGSEFNINGVNISLSHTTSGSGTTGYVRLRESYSTNKTTAGVRGDIVQIISNDSDIQLQDNTSITGTLSVSSDADFDTDVRITGSFTQSGSAEFQTQVHGGVTALSIASTTASMDFQDGNFFTLTLVSGSDTHLDTSNITAGQTITLKVLQPSTATDSYGTLSFAPEFKFAGGTAPTVTDASGSIDILTFVTTDSTDVFGTSLLNFS